MDATSDYVSLARATPAPSAVYDMLKAWLAMAEAERASWHKQTLLEAERGDMSAALYASSASEFCSTAIARLRVMCAAVEREVV